MNKTMNTLKLLEKRRSIRSFTNEPLSEDELELLLQAANGSPVAQNRVSDIKIYVIQQKELLTQIEEATQSLFSQIGYKIKGIYDTSTLILIALKTLEAPYAKALYCSAACITENMILAATEMELGNVFLTGVTTALNQARELLTTLGVPCDFEAATALAVGHTNRPIVSRDLTKQRFEITRL